MAIRTLFLALLSLASVCATAQITLDPMPPMAVCGAPTLSVAYTATGVYNAGNVFSVEISDATGSFAAPVAIGSLATIATSGSIPSMFPAGIIGGSGFAIRVVASDPPEIGVPYSLPITTVVPPDAGLSAWLTVCSSDSPINMIASLDGTPEAGGFWTSPAGAPVPGIFQPAASIPGCYTYAVAGNAPCANEAAALCVTVNQAPNAGSDATLTWCISAGPVDLNTLLGVPLSPGGSWTVFGGPHSVVLDPAVDLSGPYTYTVLGSPPCASDAAVLDITIAPCLTAPAPQGNFATE